MPGRTWGQAATPVCSCCQSVGLKTQLVDLQVDGRIKSIRRNVGGRSVPVPAAWVTCRRQLGHGITCGWGWWSTHPAVMRQARVHPGRQLLRRHQKPAGHPGRGGKGKVADIWTD